ncbi:hypothetical protein T492DRAFT_977393 [Pavlovales sp. CCMP2436]|nr:hypothetical protein T492DRAFT_977393 [Pavlovales sp. CCMP2436]|mmetsp:Transcript_11314/g.28638  ORF Transcript_11314/g.28638 Transcript_11314/m.28638 type:complete len:612 (-) Transcript_11314:220-2055(-)
MQPYWANVEVPPPKSVEQVIQGWEAFGRVIQPAARRPTRKDPTPDPTPCESVTAASAPASVSAMPRAPVRRLANPELPESSYQRAQTPTPLVARAIGGPSRRERLGTLSPPSSEHWPSSPATPGSLAPSTPEPQVPGWGLPARNSPEREGLDELGSDRLDSLAQPAWTSAADAAAEAAAQATSAAARAKTAADAATRTASAMALSASTMATPALTIITSPSPPPRVPTPTAAKIVSPKRLFEATAGLDAQLTDAQVAAEAGNAPKWSDAPQLKPPPPPKRRMPPRRKAAGALCVALLLALTAGAAVLLRPLAGGLAPRNHVGNATATPSHPPVRLSSAGPNPTLGRPRPGALAAPPSPPAPEPEPGPLALPPLLAALLQKRVSLAKRGTAAAAFAPTASSALRTSHQDPSTCPFADGAIRLSSYPVGLLLLLKAGPSAGPRAAKNVTGTWGSVCSLGDLSLGYRRTADIACRELGYALGAERVSAGDEVLISPTKHRGAPAVVGAAEEKPAPLLSPELSSFASELPFHGSWLSCGGHEKLLVDCPVKPMRDATWQFPRCEHGRHELVLSCAGLRDRVAAAREGLWDKCAAEEGAGAGGSASLALPQRNRRS